MNMITAREIAELSAEEQRHMARWINEDLPMLAAEHNTNARIALAQRMIEAGVVEEDEHDN